MSFVDIFRRSAEAAANNNDRKNDRHKDDRPENRWILTALGAGVIGLVTVILVGASIPKAATATGSAIASEVAIFSGMLLAGASLIIGGFFGFLFGIPRSRQLNTAMAQAGSNIHRSYDENTNLEQISDWLTKIIVGLTLVQFPDIKTQVLAIGNNYGPVFGGGNVGCAVAVAVLLYFFALGFLFLYLWTRIYMEWLLKRQHALGERDIKDIVDDEVAAKLDSKDHIDADTLQLVEDYLDPELDPNTASSSERFGAVVARIRDASYTVRRLVFAEAKEARRDHWRDGNRDVVRRVADVFRGLNAAAPRQYYKNYGQLAYALIRQPKPNWEDAKAALDTAIELRDKDGPRRNRYYEYHRGLCLIHLDPKFDARQASDDEQKAQIVADLSKGLDKVKIGASVDQEVIRDWNRLNGNPLELAGT